MVVVVGETGTLPPETGVTAPTPLSMDAVLAPLLAHVSVDEPPCVIDEGAAERVPVGADDVCCTTVRFPAASYV